ncbi:MAG TPA: NIPSNAP family protein [Anaerolineales bacterium]|nr:NIPSNAP family protein [Anaerolineales bacterium]
MNKPAYSPIVELRMYGLHPGRRAELIELFEREFIETQEAVGIRVLGQFYDLDDPDRFVWLRGFNNMSARAQSLHAFYSGPIWKAHRDAANATMIDSGNILLLRLAHPACGFAFKENRPPPGSCAEQNGFVTATIYSFDAPVKPDFINYFENSIHPMLAAAGASILAYFVTEDSLNTFPQLPVREGEYVFVWFAGFQNIDAYKRYLVTLEKSKFLKDEIATFLKKHLKGKPEVLRLTPTPRSWLTGKV